MSRNTLSGPFLPLPRWVLPYLVKDEVSLAVALYLLQYMDPKTQRLTTSYQHIAEQMQRSRRSVIRSVNKLEEIGLLDRTHRNKGGRSMTNQYYINFNNPETVTHQSPLETVTRESPRGDTGVTTGGDTGVTQTRENKKNKKGPTKVDRRLL